MESSLLGVRCYIVYDDRGLPVFVIGDKDDPILVLEYEAVQVLLGFITDYLIAADEFYN